MTTTTKIAYEVVIGYGLYFGDIRRFSTLKEAWELYKNHKSYVMADYGSIEKVEVTMVKKLFRKPQIQDIKKIKEIIWWER